MPESDHYTAIFSCAPQYILQGLYFCSRFKVDIYIHICAKCTRAAYEYIKPIIENLSFVNSVKSIGQLTQLKWNHPKWNDTVTIWRNFYKEHIIDGTHMQDPRWRAVNRIKGTPDTWLAQMYDAAHTVQ